MRVLAALADKYGAVLVLGGMALGGLRWRWRREDEARDLLPHKWNAERSMRETRRT